MCKSIFGVLKWSISPKKWYCCVSKHGDAMVLPPQNFHKLDVKFRFRPNSKCRISEYLWKIERKVPSWDNRTKMHRMHFVVFFLQQKEHVECNLCSTVWKPPWRITRWQHGCKAKILTTGIVWWSDTLGTWAGNSQSIQFSLHVNHYWLVVWNIFSIYWE
jgi:hypothetical protein